MNKAKLFLAEMLSKSGEFADWFYLNTGTRIDRHKQGEWARRKFLMGHVVIIRGEYPKYEITYN